MKIAFTWHVRVTPSLNTLSAQENIEDFVKERPEVFTPCHDGELSVSFLSTNPLETRLGGTVGCDCGKELYKFSLIPFSGTIQLTPA